MLKEEWIPLIKAVESFPNCFVDMPISKKDFPIQYSEWEKIVQEHGMVDEEGKKIEDDEEYDIIIPCVKYGNNKTVHISRPEDMLKTYDGKIYQDSIRIMHKDELLQISGQA